MSKIKKHKVLFICSVALFLFAFLSSFDKMNFASEALNEKSYTIEVDSIEREYLLHIPKDLGTNAPLVIVYHGYSGNAYETSQSTGFNQLADKNKFLVCYPQGTIDKSGNAFWQVGYDFHKDFKVDDVKFTNKLIKVLQENFSISKKNVFITGFSNGGDFCNLLTCKKQRSFKAAAPIISCFMKEIYDDCKDAKSIPTLMLNGTLDTITYWSGDLENNQGYGPYIATQKMIDFRINQIQYDSIIKDTVKSKNLEEKTFVAVDKYINTKTKLQVLMYSYINGKHESPDYLNLEEKIWRFFESYLEIEM